MSLSEGSRGSFEVFVEGRLVHSKLETGLVPKAERIAEILTTHQNR